MFCSLFNSTCMGIGAKRLSRMRWKMIYLCLKAFAFYLPDSQLLRCLSVLPIYCVLRHLSKVLCILNENTNLV